MPASSRALRIGFGLIACACAAALDGGRGAAQAQTCLEQIVEVQAQLKARAPAHRPPPSEPQSVGAQLDRQPNAATMAEAGVTQPATGAAGALNQAMNLQAAGDEQGCLKALAEARALAGLK